MRVLGVCVSPLRSLDVGSQTISTGIDKRPVDGPVHVGPLGLTGDKIGDVAHHGGPEQAVYVYTSADYDHWRAELVRDLPPGEFGENLTIEGPSSADLAVGDRLQVGADVVLEVTSPRIPCATFQAHLGEEHWVKRFLAARRPGVYCRVVQTGQVSAGDAVELVPADDRSTTILDLQDAYLAR